MEDKERNLPNRGGSSEKTVESGSLSPVADQLVAIAEKLRTEELGLMLDATTRLADRDGPSAAQNRARPSTAGASEVARKRQEYADAARKAYDVRRARGTIFGDPDLFGEPAWDILLDLYVAHNEGKAVSVSSACIGSASPPTTGLRWLGVLTEQGLVTRDHDPEDQRRVLVKLTDSGLSAMDRYFAEAVRRGVT